MIKTITVCWIAILIHSIAQGQALSPGGNTEFVGPFASWLDAKKNFGAKGDGKADDTKALQAGLDAAATDPNHSVLYLPAGIYKISGTLNIDNRINMSLIGE